MTKKNNKFDCANYSAYAGSDIIKKRKGGEVAKMSHSCPVTFKKDSVNCPTINYRQLTFELPCVK